MLRLKLASWLIGKGIDLWPEEYSLGLPIALINTGFILWPECAEKHVYQMYMQKAETYIATGGETDERTVH